ncbi:MAG TPA: transglutaminase-like domain-containing protein, partial [Agriterribacter sp.]|nr:transglutaminase-like domain-containing protein [Agriterribacter sp.]
AFVPEKISRFCLLAANNIKINYSTLNAKLDPKISTYDDFTLYTWQMDSSAAFKSEPYMPALGDVGASVSVSTIPSWKAVAGWYGDLSSIKTEDDFEVRRVFGEIFPKGTTGLTQKAKAHIIYNYITGNIRYSSVAFRQSAYVPQKPSVTINTALGDCKDLSALFVSLAKLAGINANLVLVNTRDYGQKSMMLPSVEFNHCIVKSALDGKPYYIELTDNNLPFGSLPSNLFQATCLVIPSGSGDTATVQLGEINAVNRTKEILKRKASISVDGNDIKLKVHVIKTGALTSSPRNQFAMLSEQKQIEEMEENLSSRYKNPVKVTAVSFKGLDEKIDSVNYTCDYFVQNEVMEVGDMKMIKIPFEDMVATVDNFSLAERSFPVEYWSYEDVDEYETMIDINAPPGSHFIELPKDEKFTFPGGTYTLQYVKKSMDKLTVIRKALLKRNNVPTADYAAMKDFLNKIVKAESKYIAFKE